MTGKSFQQKFEKESWKIQANPKFVKENGQHRKYL
jgi:hypothetical protein